MNLREIGLPAKQAVILNSISEDLFPVAANGQIFNLWGEIFTRLSTTPKRIELCVRTPLGWHKTAMYLNVLPSTGVFTSPILSPSVISKNPTSWCSKYGLLRCFKTNQWPAIKNGLFTPALETVSYNYPVHWGSIGWPLTIFFHFLLILIEELYLVLQNVKSEPDTTHSC